MLLSININQRDAKCKINVSSTALRTVLYRVQRVVYVHCTVLYDVHLVCTVQYSTVLRVRGPRINFFLARDYSTNKVQQKSVDSTLLSQLSQLTRSHHHTALVHRATSKQWLEPGGMARGQTKVAPLLPCTVL